MVGVRCCCSLSVVRGLLCVEFCVLLCCVAARWVMAVACRLPVVGYWLLVVGCWSLVVGCWLFVVV